MSKKKKSSKLAQEAIDVVADAKARIHKFFTSANIVALLLSAGVLAVVIIANSTDWVQKVKDATGIWLVRLINSVGWVAAGVCLSKALDMVLVLALRGSAKAVTIERMIHSFVKYLIAIVVLIGILVVWLGKEYITGVLGGVGVLALVIGFGAQKLIGDVIAGVFMVFEGNITVGEYVTIGGWRGRVKEIGVRSTVLVNDAGDEKVFTNSAITEFVNLSRNNSLAVITTYVDYSTPIADTEAALRANMGRLKKNIPDLVEEPEYKGIEEMGADGYLIKIVGKCAENTRMQVQRDMTREIMLIMQENHIIIAYPQMDVHMRKD